MAQGATKMYQVGDLQYFRKDDPEFADYQAALDCAIAESFADQPIGVWTSQDEGSELVAIVYGQEVFENH